MLVAIRTTMYRQSRDISITLGQTNCSLAYTLPHVLPFTYHQNRSRGVLTSRISPPINVFCELFAQLPRRSSLLAVERPHLGFRGGSLPACSTAFQWHHPKKPWTPTKPLSYLEIHKFDGLYCVIKIHVFVTITSIESFFSFWKIYLLSLMWIQNLVYDQQWVKMFFFSFRFF